MSNFNKLGEKKKCVCGHYEKEHEPSEGWCCRCDCRKFEEKKK